MDDGRRVTADTGRAAAGRPVPAYRGSGQPGVAVDRRPGAADRVPARHPDRWRQHLSGALWRGAWDAARLAPEPVAFALAAAAGAVAARTQHATRAQLRDNLSRVVAADQLDATVDAAFASYARYWVEAFRAAGLPADEVHERTTTSGLDRLDALLDDGRGGIVLLAHHGSWDVAARWAETHGYHLAVVAEVIRPRRLFARFVGLREQMGLEVVPLMPRDKTSNRSVATRLSTVLDANHLVGLLTDRDLTGSAPLVDFFGQPCHVPVGAAVLARRTGAPIIPTTMLQRPDRRWHLQVLEPRYLHETTVRDGHRQVALALEDLIRLDPAQWHALQPIWPTGAAGS